MTESKYAVVGLLGTWVMKVLMEDKSRLDLSAVMEVWMEFHARHRLLAWVANSSALGNENDLHETSLLIS